MTNEWSLGFVVLLFIAYICVALFPVFILTGLFAYILHIAGDIRRQAFILACLGIAALIVSVFFFNSPPASSSYLVFTPMSLWWTVAILLPFFIFSNVSERKPEWSDAVICTVYVGGLFLAIILVVVLASLVMQTFVVDPMVLLQFLLPTTGPKPQGNVSFAGYQFIRVIIVVGLATLSFGIMEPVRRISWKIRK